jgi:hypothetical protein
MSFLPEWYSKGVTAQDANGGIGTAAMFNKPTAEQQGNFGGFGDKISALVAMLRGGGDKSADQGMPTQSMPMSNSMPNYTPQQTQPVGPNMGQVNNPNTMSPNGQIMPNWNRTYGGY